MVLLPIGFFAVSQNSYRSMFIGLLVCIGLGLTVIAEQYAPLLTYYVESPMVSDGGPVRVAMNALPAFVCLFFSKKLVSSNESERRLWMLMSILSIVCIPLVFFASTAVDRVALYFISIQLYVYSNFHCWC